jgi:phosphatidylethanolamine-binding protein (PEBP) family uncharacterized protein
MKFPIVFGALAIAGSAMFSGNAHAQEFSFTFNWGDIPLCRTGSPNRVENPIFELSNVPEGTKEIRFSLDDRDAPNYNHGGGTADYAGGSTIQPGAFKYQSPCPPDGQHTYV